LVGVVWDVAAVVVAVGEEGLVDTAVAVAAAAEGLAVVGLERQQVEEEAVGGTSPDLEVAFAVAVVMAEFAGHRSRTDPREPREARICLQTRRTAASVAEGVVAQSAPEVAAGRVPVAVVVQMGKRPVVAVVVEEAVEGSGRRKLQAERARGKETAVARFVACRTPEDRGLEKNGIAAALVVVYKHPTAVPHQCSNSPHRLPRVLP